MNRILSLFDHSGQWPAPYAAAGHDVWLWDIKRGQDALFFDSVETTLDLLEYCDGIIAAPPCTHFTSSGAQYWPIKDADGRTASALQLIQAVECLADLFTPTDPDYDGTFFWVLENPVGRLQKLRPGLGRPFYFHPWEYAGHLAISDSTHNDLDRIRRKDGHGITADDVELVLECNAYTKKTGLWGQFNTDLQRLPIEPVRLCKQGSFTQRLGGASERTKELRSITPAGFAQAFFKAN